MEKHYRGLDIGRRWHLLRQEPDLVPPWIVILLVSAYAYLWKLRPIWNTNDRDKETDVLLTWTKRMQLWVADPLISTSAQIHTRKDPGITFGFLANWSMLFQLLSVTGSCVSVL